jgi:hypothetical protein
VAGFLTRFADAPRPIHDRRKVHERVGALETEAFDRDFGTG